MNHGNATQQRGSCISKPLDLVCDFLNSWGASWLWLTRPGAGESTVAKLATHLKNTFVCIHVLWTANTHIALTLTIGTHSQGCSDIRYIAYFTFQDTDRKSIPFCATLQLCHVKVCFAHWMELSHTLWETSAFGKFWLCYNIAHHSRMFASRLTNLWALFCF